MDNQVKKTIEEQVNELTENQKDTIIKVGKVAQTLQFIVIIPVMLFSIIGIFCMFNPPIGYDYSDTDKIFIGIMTLLAITSIYVVGIFAFVKIKWPYYSDKKWQYIHKMRKRNRV